jgi:hypothetical protein
MIKYFFGLIFIGISISSFSQCPALIFTYDVSGNRIQETPGTGCNNNNNNNSNRQASKPKNNSSGDSATVSGLSANVYPNPARDMLNIQVVRNGVPSGDSKIFLYDPTGRLLLSENAITDLIQLNVSSIAAGMYMLKVISEGNQCFYLVNKTE